MSRLQRVRRLSITFLLVAPGLSACPGCANGLLAQWRESRDMMSITDPESASRSFLGRLIHSADAPKSTVAKDEAALVNGHNGLRPSNPVADQAAEAQFLRIKTLYEKGKLEEAEAGFETLAKKHKGDSIGEKSLYYLVETQFQRGHYVDAHDTVDRLYADHPSSGYLNKALAREYQIGLLWLAVAQPEMLHPGLDGDADPFQPGLRTPSNAEEVSKAKRDAEAKLKSDRAKPKVASTKVEPPLPFQARFNGGLPAVDVAGWAEKALDHVQARDLSGPLVDRALIALADFYYTRGDYGTAAEKYDFLLAQYPKSRFRRRAQLASIDSHLKDYLGPEYDISGLEKARETIKMTRANFPEFQAATDEKLVRVLDLITDEKAARAFKNGEYYKSAGSVRGAEFYFAMIPRRWPKSAWAEKAKIELAELAKKPRKEILPSKIMTQPGAADPYASGFGSNTSSSVVPGMSMPSNSP